MSDKEFIEKLIDIRELCVDAVCDDCYYADKYHNCRFTGLPCEWNNLEEMFDNNRTHELKIFCQYYNDILNKGKSFEIRKNDRNYRVGDRLTLKEFDGCNYTGRVMVRWINYIHNGTGEFGLKKGYCILGLTDDPHDKYMRKEKND